MNILVTGSNGQLGSELKALCKKQKDFNFTFVGMDTLDITSATAVNSFFQKNNFDYCINCAAYTNVDKAENDSNTATNVNKVGPENLAIACNKFCVTLIHISTDFVFDGSKNTPYTENEKTKPINIYGKSKLAGELVVQKTLKQYFIIRTSWLYSSFGNNFVKTMQRLGNQKDSLGVIDDQIGTPTYAGDLAKVILGIIQYKSDQYGLYHYSNEGVASWYDFAKAIMTYSNIDIKVNPIPTTEYPTPALRPVYSVMNKTKIKESLKISIPHWNDSLKVCINLLK